MLTMADYLADLRARQETCARDVSGTDPDAWLSAAQRRPGSW